MSETNGGVVMADEGEAAAPDDVAGLSPERMVAEWVAAGDRLDAVQKEDAENKARMAEIGASRQRLAAERKALHARRDRLRAAYRAATGDDVKKAARPDTVAAIHKAQGALWAAVCEPGNLPLDHPVVVARLAAVRDAYRAHAAAQAGELAADEARGEAA